MIKRIVKMEFNTEKVETFKSIFQENQSKIAAQDGCYSVQLLQDIHEENIFFTYSSWESQAHLDQYRNTELFKGVWAQTKALFCNKPMAWSVQEIL